MWMVIWSANFGVGGSSIRSSPVVQAVGAASQRISGSTGAAKEDAFIVMRIKAGFLSDKKML